MTDQEILDLDIIAALGLEYLTDQEKKEIKERLGSLVEKTVELRLLNMLSSDAISQAREIIAEKGGESEDLLRFLQSVIPNAGDIYQQELISTKRNLLVTVMPQAA